MIKLALDEHFDKEKQNFLRKAKVKTLALLFLDSVYAFRGDDNDRELRKTFERLLTDKLKAVIARN